MDINKAITNLSTIETSERKKGKKLLLTIFKNIFKNPNEKQFQKINIKRIQKIFKHYKSWEDVLIHSGFEIKNGALLFNKNTIDELKHINKLISSLTVNKKADNDCKNKLNKLLSMGFGDEKINILALDECKYDINNAIQFIIDYNNSVDNFNVIEPKCIGSITRCEYVCRLLVVLTKYNKTVNSDKIDINAVLNDFTHILCEHNSDNDFEIIYSKLNYVCDVSKCKIIRRYHNVSNHVNHDEMLKLMELGFTKYQIIRAIQLSLDDTTELKQHTSEITAMKDEIMDKIHSHFTHCYHFGYRFTAKERSTMYSQFQYDNDKKFNVGTKKQIIKMKEILKPKQKVSNKFVPNQRYKKFNQFKQAHSTTFNQFKQAHQQTYDPTTE